jgi:tripartite-type tricarboxylate transporter receptor subunit TctC
MLKILIVAAASIATANVAQAQTYPTKPIKLVVPFPAGGATDTTARLVAQRLQLGLGQSVIIENQGGAGGTIAAKQVAIAAPDGYTLMMGSLSTFGTNPVLYKLDYDPMKAFTPVASAVVDKLVMVAGPALPVKSVQELVAYAKANPGTINVATAGVGTAPHLAGELLKMLADIDIVHVPYRTNYMPDVLAGQVQGAFVALAPAIGYLRAGKLRGLAVTSARRLEAVPDTPPLGDVVPGYDGSGWLGIGAPRNTPAPIVDKLNSEINAVIAEPAMRERMIGLGIEPEAMTPAQFGKLILEATEKWAKVIKFAKISIE